MSFGVLASVGAAALAASTAEAQFLQEWRWCAGQDGASPELAVKGCTAVIQSGRETKANLAVAHYNRGTAYRLEGWSDRAIQDYDQAIRLEPTYAVAYNDRGTAYSRKAQPNRAIQDFDQAIRLDPNYALAYNNRGNAYSSKGDLDRAIQDYGQAIRLDSKLSFVFGNRGLAYTSKADYERAIRDFDQEIRLSPTDASVGLSRIS